MRLVRIEEACEEILDRCRELRGMFRNLESLEDLPEGDLTGLSDALDTAVNHPHAAGAETDE